MHNSDRRSWLSGPKGPVADEGGGGEASQRQLRVARYKEERRRQLASQFGTKVADASGSSSSDQQSSLSRVRTTKTSRLRAAATTTTTDSGGHPARVVQNGVPSTRNRDAVQQARTSITSKGQTTSLSRRYGASDRRAATATSNTSSHSDREKASVTSSAASDGTSSTTSRREKDKSSKRKSNLNRSLTAEEVHPDEIHDDPAVRRRRRRAEPLLALGSLDSGLHPGPGRTEQPRSSPQFHTPVKTPPARSELPKIPSQPRANIQLIRSEQARSPQPPPSSRLEHARILSSKSERAKTPPQSLQSTWQEHSKSPQQFLGLRPESSKDPLPQTRINQHSKIEAKSTTPTRLSPSPPPKLKQNITLSLYSEVPQPSKVSQKVDKLISMTEETVARLDRLTGITSTSPSPSEDIPVMTRADSPRSWSGSPSRHPSSILKKKSLEEPTSSSGSGAVPVSILKRKTSQDEAGGPSLPVTFSPSVLEPSSKRQGILKKRSSLDESEVLRRRSYSPDMAGVEGEFRPILKNQRRLSMEELVRRTQSPDPVQPQSILKRKWSREDEASVEDRSAGSPEPQGILKRKSGASSGSSSSSTSPHVSIATAVILSVASDVLEDTVRPILKKKSSSEEKTAVASDSLAGEAIPPPKPILKKKSSADVDELDQVCQPVKPILKSSRKCSSQDDTSWEASTSARESPVRCLKLRSRSSDSTSGSEGEVRPILKPPGDSRDRSASPRHKLSFCEQEPEEQEVVVLRRASDGRRSRSPVQPRPGSVAERIMNMESFLGQATGAVPKRLGGSPRASRDRERFHTQPITLDELNASSRLESVRAFQRGVLEKKQFGQEKHVTSSPWIARNGGEEPATYITPPTSPRKIVDLTSPTDMALSPESKATVDKTEMEEELNTLCRSSSVVAKASMFAQLEEEMRRAAEEARSRRVAPGTRFRARDTNRFSTQPVTLGEVQQAAAQTTEAASLHEGDRKQGTGEDEDEPSQLSLAERVKLFNQKSQEEAKSRTVVPKRRPVLSTRFKTQPVTTEEVETARYISPLAASLAKPPDPKLLGGMSARAAREKMYEHGAAILAKSSAPSRLATNKHKEDKDAVADVEIDVKPKGILKNLTRSPPPGETAAAASASSDESEGEVKGILKTGGTPVVSGTATPELESFRHLKSVLKKETENQVLKTKSNASSENLRSILKRESTEWDESSSSSSESSDSEADIHAPIRPLSAPAARNTLDLVSILHGVEANARKQRQALVSAPNNNHEKAMNIRNLQHEKHEKENCATRQENHYVKQLDIDPAYKSAIKQRKLEAKQLTDELIKKTKEASIIMEKNHRTRPVELICKVNGSEKSIEDETAKYERQLHRQIEELQHLSSPNDTTTPPTSDGETSSSGGREVQRIIRNEAVARRRQAALARQQKDASKGLLADLQKSKSHSAVPCPGAVPVLVLPQQDGSIGILSGLRRSSTQPLTDGELRDKDSMSGASIAERLAALQKSGNNDWRKRLSRLNPEEDLTIICNTTQFNNNYTNHEHHEPIPSPPRERAVSPSSGILADRLGKLDAATQGWRKRVGPTDAVQFSVAGRMNHTPPPPSPLLQQQDGERKRRVPRARSFRSKAEKLKEVSSTPSSPQKDLQISFKRSISAPGGEDENDLSLDRQTEVVSGPKVTVPRADDETFTSFFCSSILPAEKTQSDERVDIRDEDLDSIVSSSSQLLVQKRTVRVQRKVNPSRNPLKALAARTDLQDAYIDIRTGVAEKELKRLKVEKLAKHSSLAVEALAGLASKEDFTAISLKKASALSGAMLPYKDLMLLQVKGRRHVQTRLVEPVASSINSGDNYVLVTPTEVYNYIGRYSNVIEQSRGAEVAQHIQQTKDLGCSGARQVITVSEEKQTCSSSQVENFWKLLGSSSGDIAGAGHPDEDELYESAIIASNMVYELQGEELVPMAEYWGTIPKIEMLDPSKVLVFDFGSEMYVWSGKNATMEMKRMALSLARELWAEGYDYSECDVCPLNVAPMLGQRSSPSMDKSNMAAPARPPWALIAKVNQHMETVLFREKFLDWPDFSRVIRTKGGDDEEKQVDASIDVQPCDAQQMLDSIASEPDLELENSHVGRGSQYFDEETHRHFEIKTADVTVWHITEYEHEKLPSSSVGQFHAGDSYVVRWLYSMTVTGRELSGQPSRHCTIGRDRCAYFCWQGSVASLNEQGAAALLTVELDQERGPQVRVVQGMEPPAFLSLFKGHMAVHVGKRGDQPDKTWRMYISRGELPNEGVLVEVPCSMRHLRSRASFILLNTKTGHVFVWHGVRSQPHSRQVARTAAQHLKSKPEEFGFQAEVNIEIQELEEGTENSTFFQALGGANRQLYVSLLQSTWPCDNTPRLFHLSSVSGTFCFTEVLGPYRNTKTVTSFPFLQSDLYSASQPALFLLDNKEELWLWQGWWPEQEGDDSFSDARGSGCVRWQAERRAAMQTVLDYWKLQHKDKPLMAYLVWAGLEPLAFTNLFPIWSDRDDIAELNIRDGRKPGEVLKVEEELARLTRSTYPAAQLLQRPLPDGVDPTRLELYLNPEHFQELLGMTKEEFLELPTWKQTKMKKEVGLF